MLAGEPLPPVAQTDCRRRLRAWDPEDVDVRRDVEHERLVGGGPAAAGLAGAGQNGRAVAVIQQVAREPKGSLRPRAADRREVVGDEQEVAQERFSAAVSGATVLTTRAGAPTAML